MGKYDMKKKKKKEMPLWLIPVCAIALPILVIVCWTLFGGSNTNQPTPSVPTQPTSPSTPDATLTTTFPTPTTHPEEVESEYPYLSDTLEIDYIGAYAGIFMEDGTDDVVSNLMMLILKNTGEKDLQLARINLHYADFVANFEVTNLPAGESVVLLERNRHEYVTAELLSDEAKEAIKEMHTKLQNDVAAATSATELAMIANELFSNQGIYAQMHVMIYNKLLGALIKETDSSEVVAKVAIAKEDIKSCTVVKTNEQYEEIYNRALREVTIQRNKDNTVAEINKIFEILCPGLDIHENNAAMIAIEFIGRDTTVEASEMNARLKEIADALLAEKKNGGKYVDGYIDKLLALVAETVAAADEKAEAAVLSTLLENYALDIKKAETKDAIAANISERAYGADEEMAALEAEYNADGGIIDGCANEDDLAFEKDRAALRADLYGKYVEAATSILSFGEFSELADEAKRKYDY